MKQRSTGHVHPESVQKVLSDTTYWRGAPKSLLDAAVMLWSWTRLSEEDRDQEAWELVEASINRLHEQFPRKENA